MHASNPRRRRSRPRGLHPRTGSALSKLAPTAARRARASSRTRSLRSAPAPPRRVVPGRRAPPRHRPAAARRGRRALDPARCPTTRRGGSRSRGRGHAARAARRVDVAASSPIRTAPTHPLRRSPTAGTRGRRLRRRRRGRRTGTTETTTSSSRSPSPIGPSPRARRRPARRRTTSWRASATDGSTSRRSTPSPTTRSRRSPARPGSSPAGRAPRRPARAAAPAAARARADGRRSTPRGCSSSCPTGSASCAGPRPRTRRARTTRTSRPAIVRDSGSRRATGSRGRPAPRGRGERYAAMLEVEEVNHDEPARAREGRRRSTSSIVTHPDQRFLLETEPEEVAMRIIDLFCPLGRGQRALIVSPPRAGKTILLQKIADSLARNSPEVEIVVLLIDERPEEVTNMRRSVRGRGARLDVRPAARTATSASPSSCIEKVKRHGRVRPPRRAAARLADAARARLQQRDRRRGPPADGRPRGVGAHEAQALLRRRAQHRARRQPDDRRVGARSTRAAASTR